MDIGDWFVDGAWYRLPDDLLVQATLGSTRSAGTAALHLFGKWASAGVCA
jgi:hypothetical protein